MQLNLTSALKEWAVAVEALEQGKTIMLLRKGGISEQGGRFQVKSNRVLLYPTYEHQQPALLKPGYSEQVTPVTSGWHPEQVTISSWAEITDILPVSVEDTVKALLPYHIWNEQFTRDRLKWKPRHPIYILLLRTYKLAPQTIAYSSEYGGCKSWIDIAEAIALNDTQPVLTDAAYHQLKAEILGIPSEKAIKLN